MSIKIYEAWRFKGRLEQLLPLLIEYAHKAQEKQYSVMNRELARQCCCVADGLIKHDGTIGNFTFERLREAARLPKGSDSFPFLFDPRWSVVCFPAGKHVLIIWYGPEWLRLGLQEHAKLSPYGYWNNSDREDGVSSDEWRNRAQTWERVLTGDALSGAPADLGFVYEPVFYWGRVGDRRELIEKQPSLSERADLILEERLLRRRPIKQAGKVDWTAVVGSIQSGRERIKEARELCKGPLYRRLLSIEAKLRPLTIEDLKL